MQRAYPTRINWENEPSTASPINDTNLNKMDSALYTIDGRVVEFDTTKANQSDLLTCLSNVDYNTSTGVFTFTWKNGTSTTVDLNIEKIPVSFSMSPQGVITMVTADGTEYTADVSSLIKTYSFTNSSTINFTVTTDASGNKTVVANIPDGAIASTKLDPTLISQIADAEDYAEDAEAWAVGKRAGTDVPSTDPTYHNNAKYYAEQSVHTTFASLTDVDMTGVQNGQVPTYDSTTGKYKPGSGGGSTGNYVSLVGLTDISSYTDLQITTLGNYYASGSLYTMFSDLPADIDNARYNELRLTVQSFRSNDAATRYQYLIVLNKSDGIIKEYIRYYYSSWSSGDVWSDWYKYSYGTSSDDTKYSWLDGGTEITSTNSDLNNYTQVGNYYKSDTSFACTNSPLAGATSMFRMTVSKVSDELYVQTIYSTNNSGAKYMERYYIFLDDTQQWTWGTWIINAYRNGYLSQFNTVTFSNMAANQVLKSTDAQGRMQNSYLSSCAYDSSNTLADIIGDVETLLSAL